jgi:hypothetical protein
MSSKHTLDWSVTRQGATLRLDYSGKNTDQPLYLADKLVVKDRQNRGQFMTTEKVIVIHFDEPGKDPDVIEVILGQSSTNMDTTAPMESPTYRRIDPGADFSGAVSIPFPLESWHPLGKTEPLPASAGKLQLRVEYFRGEPKGWGKVPSASGEIKVPGGNPVRAFFEGEPKPIPR